MVEVTAHPEKGNSTAHFKISELGALAKDASRNGLAKGVWRMHTDTTI